LNGPLTKRSRMVGIDAPAMTSVVPIDSGETVMEQEEGKRAGGQKNVRNNLSNFFTPRVGRRMVEN